jgi:hypothetical protein
LPLVQSSRFGQNMGAMFLTVTPYTIVFGTNFAREA